MPHPHPFRFAAQLSTAPDGQARGWADQARKAEDLGYSTLFMPDHFGDQLAPVPALMAVADATTSLRIGALVHDNDYKHPLVLAKELATLDVLSEGRLEIGLGAGWMRTDYEESGIPYDPPAVRVDRFEEGLAIIKGLLETDGPFSFEGDHYKVKEHHLRPRPFQRPRPPLIIGGGGKRVLGIAGRSADIVSVNVNLKGGTAGPEVVPDATPERTLEKVEWVRQAAGARFSEIELNSPGGVRAQDRRPAVHHRRDGACHGTRPGGCASRPSSARRLHRADGGGAVLAARELRDFLLLVRELVVGGHR